LPILSGLGAIQAAQESNRYALGADSDQGHLAPGHILTNGMKLVNNTVFLAVESVVNGTFHPGVHVLGVKENVLGYSPSLVPDDDRKSTRLNSSHVKISYAVFCLKKK